MPTDPTQLSSTVDAGEHILLGRESPLRRIPVNIQPKQAFFLDGIRHSIEMMDVSFGRLRNQLTQLALVPPEAKELASISAHIFLDAWSMVDAVDKFRQLYIGFPDMEHINSPSETRPLHEVLQSFRKLRNVGDHLSRQAELVLAKEDLHKSSPDVLVEPTH